MKSDIILLGEGIEKRLPPILIILSQCYKLLYVPFEKGTTLNVTGSVDGEKNPKGNVINNPINIHFNSKLAM